MVSAQHILRFIDIGGEPRRPPLVGRNFLHERRVAARISPGSSKGLLGRFVDQFVKPQQIAPRCVVALHVLTPSGRKAVRMRYGSRMHTLTEGR
jgi:hypothetical protein